MAECILLKTGDSREIYRGGVFLPTTEDQIIVPPEGAVEEAVVLAGDPNLLADNIKKGVRIFGVLGTLPDIYGTISIASITIISTEEAYIGKTVTISNSAYYLETTFDDTLTIKADLYIWDTYQITCEGVTRQVVVTKANDVYTVNMDGITIYSNGFDPYAMKEGKSSYGNMTKQSDRIRFSQATSSSGQTNKYVFCLTESKIDVTNFTKLCGRASAGDCMHFALVTSNTYTLYDGRKQAFNTPVAEMDISSYTGEYFVGVVANAVYSWSPVELFELLLK